MDYLVVGRQQYKSSHESRYELPTIERRPLLNKCVFSSLQIFVLLLSMLVTLQQALSSGYINSVITTIEKRFEIPSSYSGLIASSYEIGNVITVIFVSYLGSRRQIPVWCGWGTSVLFC